MPKIAAYLRVSTQDQRDRQTIESQDTALRAWFAGQAIDPDRDVIWYRDDGVSGNAPILLRGDGARLAHDISTGAIGGMVVIFSISRISRNTSDFFPFRQYLYDHNIALVGVAEGVDTRQEGGNLASGFHALIAEEQRKSTIKASRAGMLHRASQGKWISSIPYGYRLDENGYLQIHPLTSQMVRNVFDWYTKEGLGAVRIVERLEAHGVPSPRGGSWSHTAILRILRNPIYKGLGIWGRTKTRANQPIVGSITIAVPAIIDEVQFQTAARLRERAGKVNARTGKSGGILGGVIYCAVCGRRYYRSSNNRTGYSYYRHDAQVKETTTDCRSFFRVELIDDAVWEIIVTAIDDPALWLSEMQARRKGNSETDKAARRIAELRQALSEKDAALERLEYASVILGAMPLDRYAVLSRTINEQRDALTGELQEAEQHEERIAQRIAQDKRLASVLLEYGAKTRAADEATKTLMVKRLLRAVRVMKVGEQMEMDVEWL